MRPMTKIVSDIFTLNTKTVGDANCKEQPAQLSLTAENAPRFIKNSEKIAINFNILISLIRKVFFCGIMQSVVQ